MSVLKIETLNKHENPATNENKFDIENYMNANWDKIKETVNNNADELSKAQENIEELQKDNETANTDITSLKSRTTVLETDNTTNKQNIQSLQTDNATNKQNIADLQKDLAELTNYDDTEIKEDIAKIQEEQTTQNQKIEKIEDNQIHIETEQSSTINVQDCSNLSAKIDVFGSSSQETRSGKNKFNINNFKDVGFVFNGTGEVTDDYINVIATEENITYTNNALQNVDSILPEQYRKYCSELVEGENVFSFKFENKSTNKLASVYYNLLDENYKAINQIYRIYDDTNLSGKLSVTINDNNAKYLYPRFDACVGGNVVYSEIMVAQDLTEYEKYGASPSPEFPSEIENVEGDIDITIENEDKSQTQTIIFPLQEGQKLYEGSYLAGDGIHHKRKQREFDGTENWALYAGYANNAEKGYCYYLNIADCKIVKDTSISTHFKNVFGAYQESVGYIGAFSDNLSVKNKYFISDKETLEKFKAYLAEQKTAGTPVKLEYELETEEIEAYTEEQQEAYNQLQNVTPYKLVTNISTDKAKLQFNYIADTKTYVDNEINSIKEQLKTVNELLSTTKTSAMLLDNMQTDLESEVL